MKFLITRTQVWLILFTVSLYLDSVYAKENLAKVTYDGRTKEFLVQLREAMYLTEVIGTTYDSRTCFRTVQTGEGYACYPNTAGELCYYGPIYRQEPYECGGPVNVTRDVYSHDVLANVKIMIDDQTINLIPNEVITVVLSGEQLKFSSKGTGLFILELKELAKHREERVGNLKTIDFSSNIRLHDFATTQSTLQRSQVSLNTGVLQFKGGSGASFVFETSVSIGHITFIGAVGRSLYEKKFTGDFTLNLYETLGRRRLSRLNIEVRSKLKPGVELLNYEEVRSLGFYKRFKR